MEISDANKQKYKYIMVDGFDAFGGDIFSKICNPLYAF